VLGWLQRAQVDRLPRQPQPWTLLSLAEGTVASVVVIALLGAVGMARSDWPGRARARQGQVGGQRGLLVWLSLPWLVLPPFILLLTTDLVHPFYVFRYVAFCLPAVALLGGAGLAALGQPWRTGMLAAVVLLGLAAQVAVRQPGPGISVRTASVFLAAHERPGDAVIYPQGWVPVMNFTAPLVYARLRDLSLAKTPTEAGNLNGSTVSLPVLKARERGVRRIWVIEFAPHLHAVGKYITPGFRCEHTWRFGSLNLWLCVLQPAPGDPHPPGDPHSPPTARHQREHQRAAEPVLPQGRRPVRAQRRRSGLRRDADERAAPATLGWQTPSETPARLLDLGP
jgi:hypothetical protein